MKLWLLFPYQERPKKGVRGSDPWEPWYDKAFGFVVRAEDERGARQYANRSHGDENYGEKRPWLDAKFSVCVELTTEGPAGVILRDVHEA